MIGRGHAYKGNRISPSQFLMLVILRKGPMYGYEVLKGMREEFAGLWEPQTGAVYPALKKLEEHGLLVCEEQEGKEYYRLSKEGSEWLRERLDSIFQEALFMSRYFQVINDAAKEMGAATREPREGSNLPPMILHLVNDELEPQDRLKHLRKVREMLGNGILELDREIEKLERTVKGE